MSAPVSRDPLVVNTQDGSCWVRRAVTREGRGLYALEGAPACCPEYVLASLRELAEIGLRGMADALPMPVGTDAKATGLERLTPEQREAIAQQLGDAKPARAELIVSFGKSVADLREHEHPKWEDLFCLNLASYMGERMAPVLRRLIDAESERDALRARVTQLETASAPRICECGHSRVAHTVPEPHSCFAFDQTCGCPRYRQLPPNEAVAQLQRNIRASEARAAEQAAAVGELPEALHASSGAVIEIPAADVPAPRCMDCHDVGCADCPACPACDLPDWQRCVACGRCQCDRHDDCVRSTAEEAAVRRSVDAQFPIVATFLAEEPHDSELHHPYRLGRDLPSPEVQS